MSSCCPASRSCGTRATSAMPTHSRPTTARSRVSAGAHRGIGWPLLPREGVPVDESALSRSPLLADGPAKLLGCSLGQERSENVPRDELIVQLLKIALGLAIGAYF